VSFHGFLWTILTLHRHRQYFTTTEHMVAVRRQIPRLASEVGYSANKALYTGNPFLSLMSSNLEQRTKAAQNIQLGTLRRNHLTRSRDKLRREWPIRQRKFQSEISAPSSICHWVDVFCRTDHGDAGTYREIILHTFSVTDSGVIPMLVRDRNIKIELCQFTHIPGLTDAQKYCHSM
jgi:hypothetical protein